MGMVCALHHVTHYDYDRLISLGPQTIRLRPAPHCRALISSYTLKVLPEPHFLNWQQDPFSNFLARVVFPEKVKSFRVEVDLITEIKVFNPFDFFLEPSAEQSPFIYEAELKTALAPYLEIRESGPLLQALLTVLGDAPKPTVTYIADINQALNTRLNYTVRMEPGVQSCESTLALNSGSCRDMAWLACQILRHKGFATRFASGYLIQLRADQKAIDGPSGPEADFTDLHAWCEVFLPGAGWVGIDPTSGLFAGEGHIPLCCTPSPSEAAPISGLIEPSGAVMQHEMRVTRIREEARVTKPYDDDQWARIDALGARVDQQLSRQDVRLTMGGEPTFVSLDDRTGEEWHFTALSEAKKTLGYRLYKALSKRFAAGALPHMAQGKWYPGEILPRWAMTAYWRRDEKPIWSNPALCADPARTGDATFDLAHRFLDSLAQALGLNPIHVMAAHEDRLYHLWKSGRRPKAAPGVPVSGDEADLDAFEAAERARLSALYDKGPDTPTAFVLPLMFSAVTDGFISQAWQFRDLDLILIPGDSPAGLRLPLMGLPAVGPELAQAHILPPRSSFAGNDPLPDPQDWQARIDARLSAKASPGPAWPNGLIRTALCAEVRQGHLHLFLPPFSCIEPCLELITAIETVAQRLNCPVIIEGYAPPHDLRVDSFSVTPDPGVIEVNIQPAASWAQLKTITETVYDEARAARLVTDKFLLDGRRVGTGGGNHIVIGAALPEDSPFLRRPDLLGSMIRFWQAHPSLSYLFSGLYIGPTSQAPRIDEARHEALYELEIALQRLPAGDGGDVPPWLVDRLLRNLLVDLTGNTHRAEFCIDKLYNPESDRGRMGLVELRGFEMTPHARMNLVQSLLIRALIAHFWKRPYAAPFVRWGTQLHDRFMLSQYVREDFDQVLDILARGGLRFDPAWFEPFFDFRFTRLGHTEIDGLRIDLRCALEPWPVMGEERSGSGTSRGVDSSVERLEVLVTGAVEGQHLITCNGHALPLSPTRRLDLRAAGVRFKAWAPYASLHPHLPVHSPLQFDLIDTRLKRILGGCRYHVMHPGGRAYAHLPFNENEAEGRRLSRFEANTHTPGRPHIPTLGLNPDYPTTLDLRFMS